MRVAVLLFSLIMLAVPVSAKIYKWVDKNGTVHFSDKPYSGDAKEIKVKGTGIKLHGGDTAPQSLNSGNRTTPVMKKPQADKVVPGDNKIITEADYRITSSVGKLGGDNIRISGRISSGPRCKNMTVTAAASSDTGLSGSIMSQTKKVTSHGSATFEGITKVSGSADDFGFWKVNSVKISCND